MSGFFSSRRVIAAAVVAAALAAISISSINSASAGGEIGLARAIAAQEAHNPDLLSLDGVVGTGVALEGNGHAVLVLLEHPGVRGLPAQIDGVQVVPVVTGTIYALHHCKGSHASAQGCDGSSPGKKGGGNDGPTPTPAPSPEPEPSPEQPSGDPTDRFRPDVPNGVSIGHEDITAGTLGAAALTSDGRIVALSNAHVLADVNSGVQGDRVVQPGRFDSTCNACSSDTFGQLMASVPINFSSGATNIVDAAIAVPAGVNLTGATLADGYGVPRSEIFPWQDLTYLQPVQKYGRTTGQTQGTVKAVNVTVNVNYGAEGVATFVRQIWVRGNVFSAGGDSGSLVVTSDRRPVGLVFAGSSSDTFVNPISNVLNALDITIIGE